jgi:nitrite reductase/ring-hydroxylating ferredoxin subunit
MIGDTTHDLQMAASAGAAGVGVSYGAHTADALAALAPRFVAPTSSRSRLAAGARMSAAPAAVRVCASDALADGGTGVRVDATLRGEQAVVFFVRYEGRAYGYLNRCAHVPMELDWAEGQFFESSGLYLMCATHGAIYAPDTGKCVGGPCRGARLRPVEVDERDTPDGRAVFWVPDADLVPAAPPSATTD